MRLRHPKTIAHPFSPVHAVSHPAEDTAERLRAYWRAYGVTDEETLGALNQRTLQRLQGRIIARDEMEDLPFSAVVEAQRLVEEWLVEAAGYSPDASAQERATLRLTLLSGCLPDWPRRLLGENQTGADIGEVLRANRIQAVPAQAELAMPTQVIELRSWHLGARLRRAWSWLRQTLLKQPAREHTS